jgi:hypothetical protein
LAVLQVWLNLSIRTGHKPGHRVPVRLLGRSLPARRGAVLVPRKDDELLARQLFSGAAVEVAGNRRTGPWLHPASGEQLAEDCGGRLTWCGGADASPIMNSFMDSQARPAAQRLMWGQSSQGDAPNIVGCMFGPLRRLRGLVSSSAKNASCVSSSVMESPGFFGGRANVGALIALRKHRETIRLYDCFAL